MGEKFYLKYIIEIHVIIIVRGPGDKQKSWKKAWGGEQ